MKEIKVIVLEPTFPVATKITREDVFGEWSKDHKHQIRSGMVVADHRLGGFNEGRCESVGRCPVFGSQVPYKIVTVVCDASLREQVAYWLEYVHGTDCISQVRELDNNKVAFRSNYMAW